MELKRISSNQYEAWQSGKLLGRFPDLDDPLGPLPFVDWKRDMNYKSVYGFDPFEHRARNNRLKWMKDNPGVRPIPDLESFKPVDERRRLKQRRQNGKNQ